MAILKNLLDILNNTDYKGDSMWKVKENVPLKKLEKFGYNEYDDYYAKNVTNKRVIHIWKYSRAIKDYIIDYSTYSGYKYEHEYKHIIKPHIRDIIDAGMVEKV